MTSRSSACLLISRTTITPGVDTKSKWHNLLALGQVHPALSKPVSTYSGQLQRGMREKEIHGGGGVISSLLSCPHPPTMLHALQRVKVQDLVLLPRSTLCAHSLRCPTPDTRAFLSTNCTTRMSDYLFSILPYNFLICKEMQMKAIFLHSS